MGLLNCWNWKNCGRYPGGPNSNKLGVCPAASDSKSDGYLNGRNAGRACIFVAGTLCGGNKQGNYSDKKKNCMECDYYEALINHFGEIVDAHKYSNYCRSSKSKSKSNPKLPWVSPEVAPDITSKNAKLKAKKSSTKRSFS